MAAGGWGSSAPRRPPLGPPRRPRSRGQRGSRAAATASPGVCGGSVGAPGARRRLTGATGGRPPCGRIASGACGAPRPQRQNLSARSEGCLDSTSSSAVSVGRSHCQPRTETVPGASLVQLPSSPARALSTPGCGTSCSCLQTALKSSGALWPAAAALSSCTARRQGERWCWEVEERAERTNLVLLKQRGGSLEHVRGLRRLGVGRGDNRRRP